RHWTLQTTSQRAKTSASNTKEGAKRTAMQPKIDGQASQRGRVNARQRQSCHNALGKLAPNPASQSRFRITRTPNLQNVRCGNGAANQKHEARRRQSRNNASGKLTQNQASRSGARTTKTPNLQDVRC